MDEISDQLNTTFERSLRSKSVITNKNQQDKDKIK